MTSRPEPVEQAPAELQPNLSHFSGKDSTFTVNAGRAKLDYHNGIYGLSLIHI